MSKSLNWVTWRTVLRPTIVGPDVVALVRAAIREEVDGVVVPHRLRIVRRIAGDVLRRERFQIEQHQIGRPAAAIALPVAEVLRHRHVDELRASGEYVPNSPYGTGSFSGRPPSSRDGVELVVALASAFASRREQHALAVRRPANDSIGHRVIGQPLRLAAARRRHVDVDVAVVRGAVGDLRAVGRKPWKRLLARG